MLHFSKFLNRIEDMNPEQPLEVERLRAQFNDYGQEGVDKLVAIVTDETQPDMKRCNCLVILGVERASYKTGTAQLWETLEQAAQSQNAPVLAESAFHGVYSNAVQGRAESAALVEKFRAGTPEQRGIFRRVDAAFTRFSAAVQIMSAVKGNLVQ